MALSPAQDAWRSLFDGYVERRAVPTGSRRTSSSPRYLLGPQGLCQAAAGSRQWCAAVRGETHENACESAKIGAPVVHTDVVITALCSPLRHRAFTRLRAISRRRMAHEECWHAGGHHRTRRDGS